MDHKWLGNRKSPQTKSNELTRILGLSRKIGITSSLIVVLWVVCDGLSLAWKFGYGTLEIDSLQLQVCLLNGTFHVVPSLNALIFNFCCCCC